MPSPSIFTYISRLGEPAVFPFLLSNGLVDVWKCILHLQFCRWLLIFVFVLLFLLQGHQLFVLGGHLLQQVGSFVFHIWHSLAPLLPRWLRLQLVTGDSCC